MPIESICKEICQLEVKPIWHELDSASINMITLEMIIKLHTPCEFMIHGTESYMNGNFVVTQNEKRLNNKYLKSKETSN